MKKILLLFFILSLNVTHGQNKFENKQYGFSMLEPTNWIETTNKELLENLKKIEMNKDNLSQLITNNKGSLLLTSFYKYDPRSHAGIIPTIQVNVRNNKTANFEQFKNSVIQGSKGLKSYFSDFGFIKEPTEISISGIKSMYFITKFSMKSKRGEDMKVRSRTYAIPYKDYFFQVNFTDAQNGEDCTEEFDILAKSIKIGG